MITRLASLAAAMVALGVLATAGTTAAADPATARPEQATVYADLPVGAPTTLPWWQARELHVGETVIAARRSAIVSRGGTTLVGAEAPESRWSLVDGRRLRPLPAQTPTSEPLVSADGHWIAWKEVRAPRTDAYKRVERYRVVLYDAVRHRIVNHFRDRRLVAWEDGINGIWLRTVSNRAGWCCTAATTACRCSRRTGVR